MKRINYDIFHMSAKFQSSVIKKNNYTYSNVIKELNLNIKQGEKLNILDYGCGVGTISMYLASMGHNVIGIDISDKAINIAKLSANTMSLKNVNFFTIKEKPLSKMNELFDLIILIEVIEHVPKDKKVIVNIAKHLKIKGRIILTTPSNDAPFYKKGLMKEFDERVGHLRRYDIKSLKVLFVDTGIKIILITRTESVIRSALYSFPSIGWIIRFIRGPISDLFIMLEPLLINLFGGSGYYLIGIKDENL